MPRWSTAAGAPLNRRESFAAVDTLTPPSDATTADNARDGLSVTCETHEFLDWRRTTHRFPRSQPPRGRLIHGRRVGGGASVCGGVAPAASAIWRASPG